MPTEGFQRKLVFGVDRDPATVEEMVPHGKTGAPLMNPMLLVAGPGPEGKVCGDCRYLFARGDVAGTFYKCHFRPVTSGPKTDHRVGWPSCGRFEEV